MRHIYRGMDTGCTPSIVKIEALAYVYSRGVLQS